MYWEKTIEYRFFWNAIKKDLVDFAMPLSGRHERGAGDSVFGNCKKLILVEFKSDKFQLESECDKFVDYESAKRLLKDIDDHHFFVFGEESNSDLMLKNLTYFSRRSRDAKQVLSQGLPKPSFDDYLVQFLSYRKRDGRSSKKITIPEFSNVMGVSADGKIVGTATLPDYVIEALPSFANELDFSPDSSRSSAPKMR